jgi:ABC-type lipoprotein export system ATPase subunit
MEPPLLRLVDVTKSYPPTAPGGEPCTVLRNVSLEVRVGQALAIMGPSGSGKSTLLNLIGALDRPTSGTIAIAGRELSGMSDAELAALRNRELGFVFQEHHLLPHCTVLENVLVPTLVPGAPVTGMAARDRALRLLGLVRLDHRLDHRPGQLSGGERQRVAVVRALINGPRLLLADEPTGALDQASADGLARLLVELNRLEHVTLLLVTHALDIAQRLPHTLQMHDGQVVAANRVGA